MSFPSTAIGLFVPPSKYEAVLDSFFNNVILLTHFDGANNSTTFTDIKGHAITANGNVIISTAQSKFGGASIYFEGNSGLIVAAGTDFSFGLSNLTIEFFIKANNLTGYHHLIGSGGYSTPLSGAWRLYTNNNQLELWQAIPNTPLISGGSLSNGTWHHVAITQEVYFGNNSSANTSTSSGILKLWLDGIFIGQYMNTINWNDSQNNGLTIGGSAFGMEGYIDELRITKVARYTQDFTPPTAPFADS